MASRFEGVTLGVACPGTKVESKTYCVKGKAFLFVSRDDPIVLRFKVSATAAKAKTARVEVGAGGWSKLVLDGALPADFREWVAESHSLVGGSPRKAPTASKSPRKPSSKRKRAP